MTEVMKSDWKRIDTALANFMEQLNAMPSTAAVLQELRAEEPENWNELLEQAKGHKIVLRESPDPVQRARLFLKLCDHVAVTGGDRCMHLMRLVKPGESNLPTIVSSFKEQVFLPLYTYFDERIEDGDFLLALLWRYKRWVEWFAHEDLVRAYGPGPGVAQKQRPGSWAEKHLDRHLRRFLMEQGVGFPFSQPTTREGRADVVIQHGDKPLPLEIKVFDGQNRSKAHIKAGFTQAVQYAEDYQSPFGYLVVFNVSESTVLQFGDKSDEVVPRLDHKNKAVFCTQVQVSDLGAPSKRDGQVLHLTLADLANEESA